MKNTMHEARSTIVLLVFFSVASFGFDVDPELCQSALGMESRQIPDSSIMASSSYEEVIVGPLNSRIRTERFGGAWCPKAMISREVYEWLQIDFADLMVITAVETQGRYGNGQGQEYAPSYMIEYQKRDGDRLWRRYRDVKGQELFKGNNETQNAEMRNFDPFVVARRIRFVPFSHHPRAICMRVEIYGCTWRDGLVSYDMRQGDTRGDDLDFSDFLYDGFQINGHLSDGLGQLTDKRTGQSNFRLDVNNTGRRGFEWVGWRRRSSHPDQVEIQFRFDVVRNFSAVRIHANNMFSRDVRVFRSAVMHFSVGGRYFDRLHRPVESIQPRDDVDENARYVTITIDNYLARFVILVLRFDARWIMISEIDFLSELAVGNFTEETDPGETNMASTVAVQSASPLHETLHSKTHSQFLEPDAEVEKDKGGDEEKEDEDEEDSVWHRSNISTFTVAAENAAAAADHTLQRSYLAALIGTTVAVAIVTAVACVCLGVWYKRRSAFDRKYSSSSSSSLGKKSVFVVERCRLDPSGASSLIAGDGDPLCAPDHLHGMLDAGGGGGGGKTGKATRPASRQVDERSVVQEMINEQLMHDLLTSSPSNEFHRRSLPPIPSGGGSGGGRAIHPLGRGGGEGGDTVPLCAEGVVASVDDLPGESLVRLPSDRIRTIEIFGQGDYTEIRACELKRLTCHMTSSDRRSCGSDVKDESIHVIVKSLKHDASIKNRQDFEDEIKRSSKLNHHNIVRFFGLSGGSDGRIEMVLEYSKYGTLHQFLQQRTTVINTSDISSKYQPPFSHGYLIYMATEIACGMKYLESCDLVHRDLATRNCLVSNELTIKVTDMASACHRYSNHYYHIPGGRTSDPIRWMAWESILLRNFTSRSDIWSFGVTLWEILTCARTLPFDHLSNEQVLDNCNHYYQSDGQHQRLSQPTGCTREVYDLMVECWKREAGQRPTFKEIHLFLSRKNLGFNPLDEETCQSGQGIDNNNLSGAD